jgi:predicted nucleotidyltransferase
MEINEFINNLKRDKARGDLAPHQIILLISLHKLYLENKSNVIEIDDLMSVFSLTWKEHQNSFKTKNNNLGMPLKVFVNKEYLEIEISEEINDFRSKTELIEKIIHIQISTILKNLFQQPETQKILLKRINC